MKNANPNWDANTCFSKSARCNRMGLEINRAYAALHASSASVVEAGANRVYQSVPEKASGRQGIREVSQASLLRKVSEVQGAGQDKR
ncbi:hypothetical protein ES703_81278 [subsurface metagenome]